MRLSKSLKLNNKGWFFGAALALSCCIPFAVTGGRSEASEEALICENITVDGIDVGGLSEDAAREKLTENENKLKNTAVTLTSDYGNVETTLSELGYFCDVDSAIHEAAGYGNTGNILKRYREQQQVGERKNIVVKRGISEEKVEKLVNDELESHFNGPDTIQLIKHSETSVSVEMEGDHVRLDPIATTVDINDAVEKSNGGAISVPMVIVNNQDNEEAEALSHITTLLGTYTTKFSRGDTGRNQNIARAAQLMNGKIVYPGEKVSTYYTIDPITEKNGYALAGVFQHNRVVQGIGGGVCQMSSTLYNALLWAEIEIVKRDYHGLPVSYVPLSYDATMAGGYLDLIFRNNLEYPIYIELDCDVSKGYITCNIYGEEYRDPKRTIDFSNKIIETIPIPEEIEYEEDPEMAPGTEEVDSNGAKGYKTELWKYVYYNGELQDEVLINKSNYSATPKRIRKGPGTTETETEATEATESTEETEDTTEATEAPSEDTEAPSEDTEEDTEAPAPEPPEPPAETQEDPPAEQDTPPEEQ